MNKKIILFSLFVFMAASGFSQTTARAEKAMNDPMRAENSAKADVHIQQKTICNDRVQTTPVATFKSTAHKRNKKQKTR